MKGKSLMGKIAIFVATIVWGSSFFILKNAIDVYPTFFVLAVRFSIGAAIIGLIFIKNLLKMTKKAALHGAILGLIVFGAYALQTVGLKYTTPSKNAFLTAGYVVLVPFLGWFLLKSKPGIKNIIAGVLCIAGIGCVSLNGGFNVQIGDILTICSGIFYSLQIVFIKKYTSDDDSMQLLFMELAVIAVASWIVSLSAEKMPSAISADTIWPLIYLAVVCTALAQLLQMVGQKYTSSNSAAIILSLESVFGTVFSVIFYHEILTVQNIIGFVIIFAAILVGEIDWSKIKPKRKKKDDENGEDTADDRQLGENTADGNQSDGNEPTTQEKDL